MKKNRNTKKIARKKAHPMHIQDMPKRYFPRKTKSKDYRDELVRMMNSLRYTNEKIQYTTQLCTFNIRCIARRKGFKPLPSEVFRLIEEFVYHYENYCFRAFAFREKLLKFINAVLPVGFDEGDVKIQFMIINPVVIQAGLLSLIQEFNNTKGLGKAIKDRHLLTHKLYYGKEFDHYLRPKSIEPKKIEGFKKWCSKWKKEISERAKLTVNCMYAIYKMNHDLTARIIKYKDSSKKKKK